ncbi:glycosyltransferase family 2 protein [Shewanella acanthi]|uniref:glycosyltransferase family 2 protein n=1 Tax=Shewanella acanthi TaxID=2864212 RepID=UPI001C65C72B|nr:hypothetical protein [Shewanella acanthi]QYJ79927.1 hypothetical protein K0H61_05795 [Shewanella acanthi]
MKNYFITVNYRSNDLTAKCCKRTFDAIGDDCFYIIVDNSELLGNQEKLISSLNGYGLDKVTTDKDIFFQGDFNVLVLTALRNGGFSYGNNIAINLMLESIDAHPDDIITLINSDAYIESGFSYLKNNIVDNCIYGATLISSDSRLIQTQGGSEFIDFRINTKNINEGLPVELGRKDIFAVNGYINGAFMSMRKRTLTTLGIMDESYFMWCEEIDWCLTAKKLGIEMFCVPNLYVIHVIGGASSKDEIKSFLGRKSKRNSFDRFVIRGYYHFRNKIVVYRKHFNNNFLKFYYSVFCEFLVRSVGVVLYDSNKLKRVGVMLKGIYHGIINNLGRNDSI